ncbi:alpha/beta hydrolase [Bacillus sp. FSL W8-0183]|uniref:alpha/beta hydrolase n=1 Tax=Bacillus sp. FSL W8-0183 TaxID=2954568 RepID=UPI0030F506BC
MKKMDSVVISKTIHRTLKTARLFDVFWERWLVHGLEENDLQGARPNIHSLEGWYRTWSKLAEDKEKRGRELEVLQNYREAEKTYRQAALYYILNYWIDPSYSDAKMGWYQKSLDFMRKADSLSDTTTVYPKLLLKNHITCSGRIRVPKNPKGVIIIVNPIDSTKEELYLYEMDFLQKGFITMSFDGPGQGETFMVNGVIGTRARWERFVHQVIDDAKKTYPHLPIYLFGISLAASWVLYGSSNKNVDKVVAVSPAVELERMNMPSYFMKRMECSCIVDDKDEEETERSIPKFDDIKYRAPVLVFYGSQDMMITKNEFSRLYENISSEKLLIEYKEEGHVCNHKLKEIRDIACSWFSGEFNMKEEQ